MTPVYAGQSAAAPVLRYEEQEEAAPVIAASKPNPITYQPSLFTSRELPHVVPFESIAPQELAPAELAPPETFPSKRRKDNRHRKVIPGQQSLEFPSGAARAEGAIYCDAPVAIPSHRSMAAALDASVVLVAFAIFGTVFFLAGGQIVVDAKTAPYIIGIVAALAIFYKVLWALGDGDTAGMRWMRLKLVNFDGQGPTRKQRFFRLASGTLSFLAAGLGLLWGLVDEETLTWHDHMSKTFPTPY